MNIAFDPWIPVVTMLGKPKLASLNEVLTEGDKFTDLSVRPHERVSLMRLFICVAHASLKGPKDFEEWEEARKRLPEAAQKYLTKWDEKECFELFHPQKPWLQVAELNALISDKPTTSKNENIWSPLNKLSLTSASGNTPTLFDHTSNAKSLVIYSPEEIVLNLLTFQNYFVAGGKASSRRWGDIEMKNPPNPKGGPCAGKCILFTFLRGRNVAETIHLNLSTFDDLKLLYGNTSDMLGKAIWEMPITSPIDENAIKNATMTHIGRLVPQTRILRVNKDCKRVLLGSGFPYPKFQDEKYSFFPDKFATVIINDKGERELLSARLNKSVWRQLYSLTVRRNNNLNSSRGPLCLLNVQENSACDIVVNAMITNPKQAAEVVSLTESVFHIPAKLLMPKGTMVYESEVKKSELWSNRLGMAAETYRREVDDDWENRLDRAKQEKWRLKQRMQENATIHFWTTVEKNLSLLMTHIESIDTETAMTTRGAWRKMIFSAACESYKLVCGQETPRQMKAFAMGWQVLTGKRDNQNKQSNSKKEKRS